MKKNVCNIFIALLLVLCLIPGIGLMVVGPAEAVANETAAAAPKLVRNGTWNADFLSDLSDYVGKGFFLRPQCITLWDRLCSGVFGTSANDDVVLGREGWLFYAPTVSDYTGSDRMSDRELYCAARSLALMAEYAESCGAEFVFTIAPNKNTLYGEYMPSLPTVSEGSNRESLVPLLAEQGVNYLDLVSVFAAEDEILYWQTDSHWNGRGAALAADAIADCLGLDTAYFSGPFEEGEHTGDLYEMLYPASSRTETDWVYSPGYSYEYTSRYLSEDDITIRTTGSGEGTLLLFRDSFGRNLFPYLADGTAEACFSRANNYRLDWAEGTDAVVVELVERNLSYLLQYPPVLPAPERDSSVTEGLASAAVSCDSKASDMEGYVCLSGSLPGTADESSVYLLLDGALFETTPGAESFTAHVPEAYAAAAATVFYLPEG